VIFPDPIHTTIAAAIECLRQNDAQGAENALRTLAYWTHSTSLEHIIPMARGGADELSNYATTCYACNAARGDFLMAELGWELRAIADQPWDGLRGQLPVIVNFSAAVSPACVS